MQDKLIKIILTVLLVFSVFPHAAYAEQDDPGNDPVVEETVTVPEQEGSDPSFYNQSQ